MTIGIEVELGDGRTKPAVRKTPGGTWVVRAALPPSCVAHSRALWARTFKMGQGAMPVDGKGFLVGPTGKLTKG